MRYLCLVYHDERQIERLSPSDFDTLASEAFAYDEELRHSGHLVASDTPTFAPTTLTIRVRQGRTAITEGPCAAKPEQLGGFLVIDARDLNEAIRVAERIPSARLGCVEVRPVQGWRVASDE